MIRKINKLLKLALLIGAFQSTGCGKDVGIDKSCKEESSCTYPKQSESPYILPWAIGERYKVTQGNCTKGSHNRKWNQQFAYDFEMSTGTAIHAVRGGVVISLEAGFSDGTGKSGEENEISIQHEDGSVAQYIHLTTNGVLVELEQVVEQGQLIGLSGNSGNSTGPHLHFHVLENFCPLGDTRCLTIPLNFKNTEFHENGLVEGKSYTAEQVD